MYFLDTDASEVAIYRKLHQEQERNGRTVLRPIADGSKELSDTEMKYRAQKAQNVCGSHVPWRSIASTWGILPSSCEWTTQPYPG